MNLINVRKKIIATVIIVSSLLVAGFLIFDSTKNDGEFLKLVKSGLDDYRFAFSSGGRYRNVMEGENRTERFIQKYGSQIAIQNPEGPEGDMISLPSQEIFNNLLAEEITAGISYEPISEEDIRLRGDSEADVSEYIISLREAMEKRKTDLFKSLFEFSENGRSAALSRYISESEIVESKLSKISAPTSWKGFHTDLVNFERRRIAIVLAITRSEEDPVKGLAAMEELTKLNELELKLAQTFATKSSDI